MLTYADINTLLEALDAYESSFAKEGFTSGLLGMILSGDKCKEERADDFQKTMDEARENSKKVEEKVILLKAKLIMMRDELSIKDAIDYLKD